MRKPVIIILSCILVLGMMWQPSIHASADTGPKPEMTFEFEFEIEPVEIVSGQQIECDNESCTDGKPLEELGPQGFNCTEDSCSSMAYGYSDYHKLVIEFEDKTRESNIFTADQFNAKFKVRVLEDSLIVEKVLSTNISNFCCAPALLFTVFSETLAASILFKIMAIPFSLLGLIPAASLVTLPALWLLFTQFNIQSGSLLIGSEIGIVFIEAIMIFLLSGRRIPFKNLLFISAIMNLISFTLGFLL